ncbi:GNAT family N-acetyltransferase [Neorhizobium sp. NPDC001467]|uniref:GNAT family N-acetyltransferase n=1 Tax=Neorhizobium sp. NPDC001467 TaxID=3390595 RepID=UPI003D0388EB
MTAVQMERRIVAEGIGPCPVIRTSRLLLRPHRAQDADAIAVSLCDFSVSRMLARVPVPYHRQDAVDWLGSQAADARNGWSFAVCDTDASHIGAVGIDLRHGRWHLGYWLNRSRWNRGLMTEAAGAALRAFFERMPETPVHSGMFCDNAGSLRVQQKLGFAITGCRDVFSVARGHMVTHIDTVIDARDLAGTTGR